jgi:hypothetical protein
MIPFVFGNGQDYYPTINAADLTVFSKFKVFNGKEEFGLNKA